MRIRSCILGCHGIKAVALKPKIRRGDKEDVIKDWSSGIEAELGKYEKVVEELKELKQKLREQEARETQEKKEKAKLEIKTDNKLCFNGAGTRHIEAECRCTATCQRCNGKNHSSICDKLSNQLMLGTGGGQELYTQ